jgi:YHS domain-containing protein
MCTVELVENERWVPGNRRWGAFHRGRLYLFAGENQQQRFMSNPDFYSPVLSGNDPVLALEDYQTVSGKRQHGVYYNHRVYLFSSEETLARFYRSPDRYAEVVLRAEATTSQP